MIVDSHVHLHLINYKKLGYNLNKVLHLARLKNVKKKLCVATNISQFNDIIYICNKYDDIYGSIGVHPNQYYKDGLCNFKKLYKLSKNKKIIAIGETGLDYFHSYESRMKQIKAFEQHIEISILNSLPLIIHSRDAKGDIINILKHFRNYCVKGVIHCFNDDIETAKKAIDLGFLISFSGIITFKNEKRLKSLVKNIPLDKILVETDTPYLAPEPHRGKVNQPSYIVNVVQIISELTGNSLEYVSSITTNNFNNLFFR